MTSTESAWPAGTVDRVAALVRSAPPRAAGTRVLAIDGPSAAGKTTLGAELAAVLTAPVVHLEDLYPGWDGLAEAGDRLLEWVLHPLASGGRARFRRYDWDRQEYSDWVDVPAAPVLIVEGAGVGTTGSAPYFSLLVWLEAPEPVRFARAMDRDGDTYRSHWQRWAEQERRLLAEHDPRGRADVILGSQDPGVT